jgi:beta-glucosidase
MQVSLDVVNTGEREGAEIVQLYIAPPKSAIFKAAQELKGFEKVRLRAGERKRICFSLTERDFAFYDTTAKAWRVEAGDYKIRLSASSRDIRLTGIIHMAANRAFDTPVPDYRESAPCYYELSNGIDVPDEAFAALYGAPLPPLNRLPGTPHTPNSTFADIQDRPFGRFLARIGRRIAIKMVGGSEDAAENADILLGNMPLRALLMLNGQRVTHGMVEGIAMIINGQFFRGLGRMMKKVK